MSKRAPSHRHRHPWVIIAGIALVATACGSPSDADSSGQSLADMEPTTLQVQSSHSPEAAPSRAYQAWQKAVEEASEGKLTFEMHYNDALAPITEVEDALATGLMDIGTHAPMYNPARFPTEDLLQSLNSTIKPSPIAGTLQAVGAQTEFAFDDANSSETTEGTVPLIKPMTVIPAYHLGCAGSPVRSLDEAAGKRVRVPGEHLGAEAKALGMTPTATEISEVYESLERGVVDCILASPSDIRDLGLIDVIDHWVIDSETMWTGVSGVQISMSKDSWDELPTAAQDVLWNTATEAFIPTLVEAVLEDTADSIEKSEKQGVEFHSWRADAKAALKKFHEDTIVKTTKELDNGDEVVTRFTELHQTWLEDLPRLGFDDSKSKDEFVDFDPAAVDLEPYVERLKEVRDAGRP